MRNPFLVHLPISIEFEGGKQTGGKQKDKGHLDLEGPSKIRNELRFFYLILKQRYN